MGIFQCPIHGHQGFDEYCEHIFEDFENEVIPEMKELPILLTKICDTCFTKYKVRELEHVTLEGILELSEEVQIEVEEQLMAIYESIKRKGKCIECLNNLHLTVARRMGKELPFKPYENTLMHKDNETIEKLRNFLIANFEFQKFKNKELSSLEAFTIISGAVSYPFSISFYYITNKEKQKKLLKLIDTFFEHIPQKQRKISFYESNNWITEDRGIYGIQSYRGEQKLLLERIVE